MRKFLLHNLTFSEQTFSKLMMTTEKPSPLWRVYKIALNVYSLNFTLRFPFFSFIYRLGNSSKEGELYKLAYFGVDPLAEFASAVLHLDDPNMVLVLGTMPIFTRLHRLPTDLWPGEGGDYLATVERSGGGQQKTACFKV
ncbi:hypothetical protein TYRP_021252 [Tyrophagus putrescentiae]|nr:hypothetical protein TYRP_021252 [Tyrophagus putrescentiae]